MKAIESARRLGRHGIGSMFIAATFAVASRVSLLLLLAVGATARAETVASDPGNAHLEVRDLRRFAQVLRLIEGRSPGDQALLIERQYLASASRGMRLYAERYGVTGSTIVAALAQHAHAYADLDAMADTVLAQEPAFRAAFRKLEALYPDATFPPVWFVVGHYGPGGLARSEGVLVAAETFVSRPADLVPLVLHELAHVQSVNVQGLEVYRRIFGPEGTLLALAIREGTAELIAELTTGSHVNPAAERYGLLREAQLWSRFQQDMRRREPGDWMFARPAGGEPPDLGYWIGYRIARSYYELARDRQAAIRQLLGVTDFEAFLAASGYAERFAEVGSPNGSADSIRIPCHE